MSGWIVTLKMAEREDTIPYLYEFDVQDAENALEAINEALWLSGFEDETVCGVEEVKKYNE